MIPFAIIGMISSIFLTLFVRKYSQKLGIVDRPDHKRKFHDKNVPLLGGVAIFLAFWIPVGYLIFFNPINGLELVKDKLIAAFIASLILLVLGIADDIKGLTARFRLLVTMFAIAISVVFGLGLSKITNPFGGVLLLSEIIGGGLVFFWLLGMTYTIKITDGLDGLAAGIVAIGSLMLYFLANSHKYYQPNVALLCLIFFGAVIGFLIFNFHPASIFLGESGSLFIGYMLGVLAVISGGKVAIALVAMAIPVFDLARVIIERNRAKVPIFEGDRRHLHYRLVDLGISPAKVTIIYYIFAALFGYLSLKLQTIGKVTILLILVLVMILVSNFLKTESKKNYDPKK